MPKKTYNYPLGFHLQSGSQIVFNSGGTRPATQQEIAMWKLLMQSDPNLGKNQDELNDN